MIDNTLDSLDFADWIWRFQLNLSSIALVKEVVSYYNGRNTNVKKGHTWYCYKVTT